MSGLQMKPGKGVDLRQFGEADIQRVSEILWHKKSQKWYIKGVSGPLKGHVFHHGDEAQSPQFFKDYDEAVAAEIEYLNKLRREGTF
jgi:hypothetical protein